MNAIDLSRRTAIVTGGSAGIGLATAHRLRQAGANVSIWGRSPERLADAAQALEATSAGPVHTVQIDVADESAVVAGVAEVLERFGRPHVVIANAGIGDPAHASLLDSTTKLWHSLLDTNLLATMWLFREAARAIIDSQDGSGASFIAMSSVAGIEATPRNLAYGASKAAQMSLVKGAAVELAPHRIRVNAICPGWIETDQTTDIRASDRMRSSVDPRIPARRWGQPDDIAGAALYLASDLSAYQTGSATVVDGGYSIF